MSPDRGLPAGQYAADNHAPGPPVRGYDQSFARYDHRYARCEEDLLTLPRSPRSSLCAPTDCSFSRYRQVHRKTDGHNPDVAIVGDLGGHEYPTDNKRAQLEAVWPSHNVPGARIAARRPKAAWEERSRSSDLPGGAGDTWSIKSHGHFHHESGDQRFQKSGDKTLLPAASRASHLNDRHAKKLRLRELYRPTYENIKLSPKKMPGRMPDPVRSPSPTSSTASAEPHIKPPLEDSVIAMDQLKGEIATLYSNVFQLEEKVKQVLGVQQASFTASQASGPSQSATPLSYSDHFQLMFALHRNLLQEYYDLFRATEYASTLIDSPEEIKEFCQTHSMPSRLWKNGVHNLLEFWRTRLPESKEYLHAYIYLAYQMFTLLEETVKKFNYSWLECLGDLARYRMAIESENPKERDSWSNIADVWYAKASHAQSHLGRLNHHKAILARRQGVWQMQHRYSLSLCAIVPFTVARSSMEMTVFKPNAIADLRPLPEGKDLSKQIKTTFQTAFIRITALNYDFDPAKHGGPYQTALTILLTGFVAYVQVTQTDYGFVGEAMAITNITALLGWGMLEATKNSGIRQVLDARLRSSGSEAAKVSDLDNSTSVSSTKQRLLRPWYLTWRVFQEHLKLQGHETTLAHVHVMLIFMWSLATAPHGPVYLMGDDTIPWKELEMFLNSWTVRRQLKLNTSPWNVAAFIHPATKSRDHSQPYSQEEMRSDKILHEDRHIHGSVFAAGYLPENHFRHAELPEEEKPISKDEFSAQRTEIRIDRIVWLALRLVTVGRSLRASGKGVGQWLSLETTSAGSIFTIVNLSSSSSQPQESLEQSLEVADEDTAMGGSDL